MDLESDSNLRRVEGVLRQPDLLFRIGSMLSFDDAVALHDAFPSLWRMWTYSSHYVRWFRRHLHSGVEFPSPAWKSLSLTNFWQKIDFYSYVQHVHYHRHGSLHRHLPKYKTDILQFCGMVPASAKFLVKACIFLPRTAPAPFSGNLVLLGLHGELATYAASSFSYEPTSHTQLDFCPDALCCSPRGSVVLLPSSHGHTSAVVLGQVPVVYASGLCLDRDSFRAECFWTEDSFLAWSGTSIVKHTLGKNERIKSVPFCSAPPFRRHRVVQNQPVFWVKPKRGLVPACLIFGEVSGVGSLSTRLRVVGGRADDRDNFVSFEKQNVRVCDCVLHPSQNTMFVMCIHRGSGKLFFSTSPLVTSREPTLSDPGRRDDWYGTICFYHVNFLADGEVEVLPRFFAGRYSPSDVVDHWGHLYGFKAGRHARAVCTDTHLSVKFQEMGVCHFSLIASPLSQPYYETDFVQKLWAISRDHRHHVFFQGDEPHWETPVMVGYRECPKYDKSVDYNKSLVRQDSPRILTVSVKYV